MQNMNEPSSRQQSNWRRRSIGILICLIPFELLVLSFVIGISNDLDPFGGIPRKINFRAPVYAGTIGMIGAGLIAGMNLHLSFVRPRLHRRRNGSMDGYRNISGFPLICNLLTVISGLITFGSSGLAVVGVILLLVDPGGTAWFLFMT